MGITELVHLSRWYGSTPGYVIGGGGNTSYKEGSVLYIKGSGTSLATIDETGFVRMNRGLLSRIWERSYSTVASEREAQVLDDLMAARLPGEEHKRPSVETLLHDLLPFGYVVHTHPALINGLTCAQLGETVAHRLFGEKALWIPYTDPGYVLSCKVREILDERVQKGKEIPPILFLENHGIFVGGSTPEEIQKTYSEIMNILEKNLTRRPNEKTLSVDTSKVVYIQEQVQTLIAASHRLGGSSGKEKEESQERENAPLFVATDTIVELEFRSQSEAAFSPLRGAFTPDHIVYAGPEPLYIPTVQELPLRWESYYRRYNRFPKVLVFRGIGAFGVGNTEKAAHLAVALFMDSLKIAAYAESFGGSKLLTKEQVAFILNWEVEQYRSQVSTR
ncbi:MAG: class II aldolase/adducin family protein [Treponemataceae bacterium]|nr:class II aldolase/adducin family protein [Treponemataceae bacterium]